MRLIDADKFKKYILQGIDGIKVPEQYYELAKTMTKNFLKDIDDQPTIKYADITAQYRWERDAAIEQLEANGLVFGHNEYNGWIPCSERLPDEHENTWYLVTSEDGRTKICFWGAYGWRYNRKDEFIAWMRMPKPYKGVNNEK